MEPTPYSCSLRQLSRLYVPKADPEIQVTEARAELTNKYMTAQENARWFIITTSDTKSVVIYGIDWLKEFI